EKYNFVASYGEGSEEFMVLSIDPRFQFNSMEGRWNAGMMEVADTRYYADPSSALGLTGVKDLNLVFNAIFNDKTEGMIQFESVKDNDSSAVRTIAGAQNTVGHPVMDYNLFTISIKHQYRPNTYFGLSYTRLSYAEEAVNNVVNGGGWDRMRAEVGFRY
ncbi:hypothetical protein KAJ27_22965, partial [bacterium]|nr:hypothetical protein [bacterium]